MRRAAQPRSGWSRKNPMALAKCRGGTVRTCEDYGGSAATRIRELAVGHRTLDEHSQTLLVLSVSFDGNSVSSSPSCHRLTDHLRFQCDAVFAHYFHFCPYNSNNTPKYSVLIRVFNNVTYNKIFERGHKLYRGGGGKK